jgi:hypothetical protein
MKSHRRWARVLRVVAVAAAILVFGLAAFVNVQQRVLRWRAERLLEDIRAIQMGKSTWADAQRLMTRWGAWGMWDGSCTAEACEYQIVLRDVSQAMPSYFWTRTRQITRSEGRAYREWELWAYSLLGGRVTRVSGDFRVKDGLIWTRSFTVFTARNISAQDFLIADFEGKTRFRPVHDWDSLQLHPEYTMSAAGPCAGCRDGACTVCELIRTRYTPFADPEIIDQLSQVNLSCITKWIRCSEPREIMPVAWQLYQRDGSVSEGVSPDWPSCRIPVEALARDYPFALSTRVEAVNAVREKDGHIRYEARLQPLADLKGDAMHEQSALAAYLARVRLGWTDTVLRGGVHASDVKPGDRIVFLFEELPSAASDGIGIRVAMDLGETGCSYIPDTAENRKALQTGIERDHN